MSRRDDYIPSAYEVPYDKDNDPQCDLTQDTTQEAIDELCKRTIVLTTPSFTFSRKAKFKVAKFLKIAGGVNSDRLGIPVDVNVSIKKVIVGNKEASAAYTVEIWSHKGEMTNANLIGSLSIPSSSNTIHSFDVDWPIPSGVMVAVKIIPTTSPWPEDVAVYMIAKGTL